MKKIPRWKEKFIKEVESMKAEDLFEDIAWENPVQLGGRFEWRFKYKVNFFKNRMREECF